MNVSNKEFTSVFSGDNEASNANDPVIRVKTITFTVVDWTQLASVEVTLGANLLIATPAANDWTNETSNEVSAANLGTKIASTLVGEEITGVVTVVGAVITVTDPSDVLTPATSSDPINLTVSVS